MDPVTIAATVARTAKTAWDVGASIYTLVQSTRIVDDTVNNLASEVTQLGDVSEAVRGQLELLAQQYAGLPAGSELNRLEDARLGSAIKSQLVECDRAMTKLKDAISGVRKKRSNFATQTYRQIRLDMNKDEIEESRTQIRAHTSNLQISLQLVSLKATYLAPRMANQELLTAISKIESAIKERGHEIDGALVQSSVDMVSSGMTLYEASVAGGSVKPNLSGLEAISRLPGWLEALELLQIETSASEGSTADSRPRSLFSTGDDSRIDLTTATTPDGYMPADDKEDNRDDDENDLEDDFALEIAQSALATGRAAFEKADYRTANEDLQEALKLVRGLSMSLRRKCDMSGLRYQLAVCAYHVYSLAAAEAALVSVISLTPGSRDESLNLCHAGYLLAQVYIKQGKIDLARGSCESALRGHVRLLGKQNTPYFDSLALLSRINELQSQDARARIILNMIPEEVREAVYSPFSKLDLPPRSISTVAKHDFDVNLHDKIDDTDVMMEDNKNSAKLGAAATDKALRTIDCDQKVRSLAISPDGKVIATGTTTGLNLWDLYLGKRLVTQNEGGGTLSLAIAPDNRLLLTGSYEGDGKLRIWDCPTGFLVGKLKASALNGSIHAVAFSWNGKLMASTHGDKVKLRDATTMNLLREIHGRSSNVFSISFSPDDELVVLACHKGFELWEVATGRWIRQVARGHEVFPTVAFSSNGKVLATSKRYKIVLWDTATWSVVHTLDGHKDFVRSFAFLPDSKLLASGSSDRTVKLWDVATGKVVKTFKGHTSWVNAVASSPNGRLIASGSNDKTIKLWDVGTADGSDSEGTEGSEISDQGSKSPLIP